jgi:hypothetical protein
MGIILTPLGTRIILTPLGMGIILTPARGGLGAPARGALGAPARGALGAPARGGLGAPARGGLGAPARGALGAPARGGLGAPARGGLAQRPPRRSGSSWRGGGAVPIGWANSKGAESLSISLAAYGSPLGLSPISVASRLCSRASLWLLCL